MKEVIAKDKFGGQFVIKNVWDEYHARGYSFYMNSNTDAGYHTVYKLDADGVFVGEKNTQAEGIRAMMAA